MRGFLEIVFLELRSLVRSRTLAMLLVAGVGWMFAFPYLLKGDGTVEGARELYLRFSLGGVFALTVVTLLASATGSLARERAAKRLQLTLVRPVRYLAVVLGKIVAHVAVGAAVLAAAAAVLAFKSDLGVRCYHVHSPLLPAPREEAKSMYEAYMKDPETPEEVKKAKKDVVLRLLENRAIDHFQAIPTNSTTRWRFPSVAGSDELRVRMRFSAQFDTRQDVRGVFRFGDWSANVSNLTKTVVSVPLRKTSTENAVADELSFINEGKGVLMLRPRRDIEVLVGADGFGPNLARAWIEMTAILAFVVAFGMFLSAGLGRPVALFVAFVTLLVGEMSPSVLEQYPDSLETNAIDRIGLAITRTAAEVTRPFSSASPLEALANDERVEPVEVLRLVLLDALAFPLVLAFLSALALPRKQESQA